MALVTRGFWPILASRMAGFLPLGSLDKSKAKRVLDVDGCYVAPGFIDIHSHSDLTLRSRPL